MTIHFDNAVEIFTLSISLSDHNFDNEQRCDRLLKCPVLRINFDKFVFSILFHILIFTLSTQFDNRIRIGKYLFNITKAGEPFNNLCMGSRFLEKDMSNAF